MYCFHWKSITFSMSCCRADLHIGVETTVLLKLCKFITYLTWTKLPLCPYSQIYCISAPGFVSFPALLPSLHFFLKIWVTCKSSAVPVLMHESSSAVNAFYTPAGVPALPFFLVYQSCLCCSLLPGYGMDEWKGIVSNVLSSQLLLRVESGGSAACEVVNSAVMRCTSQLARARGIMAHCSSESTGRSMGQRLSAFQCSNLISSRLSPSVRQHLASVQSPAAV